MSQGASGIEDFLAQVIGERAICAVKDEGSWSRRKQIIM
jgi:hypothetical protein